MRKYFYFRDVADEADDDDIVSSIAIPVDSIAGVVPVAITTLELYLNKGGSVVDTKVTLTVTRGKLQEVMHEIVQHINGHTLKTPLTVMCDAAATTVGASSIEGDNNTKDTIFFSNDVTAVAIASAGY